MALEDDIVGADHWFLGEDKFLDFIIYTDNTKTVRQVITGWALEYTVRRSDLESDPFVLQKTTGAGIVITNGPQGEGRITIEDTDTALLKARVYRHALKRTDPGAEAVLTFGNAVLRPATTR